MLSPSLRTLIVVLLLLRQVPLPAQTVGNRANNSATDGSSQSSPVLRTTTRLVQLNVVVRKKNGDPVTGLKPEDFSVLDDGQPQKIAVFSSETIAPAFKTATAVPANVFSNRLDRGGKAPGSVTIILFDTLNTSVADQAYARQQAIKFLRGLQPGEHVAIYALTTQIKILHEFTEDTASLLRALDRYRGQSSALLDAATPSDQQDLSSTSDGDSASALDEFLSSAYGALADFANINRATTTMQAFEAIAHHVADIPGRKNLVWFSASFPLNIGFDGETLPPINREMRSFTPEVERAAREINQANMAIYPVDARGLMPSKQFSAAQRFSGANPRSGTIPSLFPDHANFDAMNMLAERTGGRAFYNTNDLAAAAHAAISDAQFSYLIGFYPDHGMWDGKFHALKVRVSAPHTEIRYRQGYFATSGSTSNAADTKAALQSAAGSPVESTGLGIQATVSAVEPPNKRILKVSTFLDSHEVAFTEANGRWAAGLELLFLQLGAGNKTISGDQKTVDLNLQKPRYDTVLKDGLILTGYLPMAPETRRLRVVVLDRSSGALGSVSIPVEKFLAAADSGATQPKVPQKN